MNLNLIEEVVVRLQRGANPERFGEDLKAFLKNPSLWRGSDESVSARASTDEPKSVAPEMHGSHPYRVAPLATNWLDSRLTREMKLYADIEEASGVELTWPRDLFMATLEKFGREAVEIWEREFGLRVGTIPDYAVYQNAPFPQNKPCTWFYKKVLAGKIGDASDGVFVPDTEAFRLRSAVVLFDPRRRPMFKDGHQLWPEDKKFLGGLIARLRNEKKLCSFKSIPSLSRFGVSPDDWEWAVKPVLGSIKEFAGVVWRLERVIEWSFLCQTHPELPRATDGETDTWIQFEDCYKDARHRLCGGRNEYESYKQVYECHDNAANIRNGAWSLRPLGVLAAGG
ncbi:hypothetical protein EPN90_01630 [Patescibacteria group bacterium]|nr:MAG: hypothetical protein EPN90_01630 [Patescibacteria group bacterium]